MFGRRSREYRGDDFSVRLETDTRELMWVVLTRRGVVRKLEGQWIGKGWGGIGIDLPQEIEAGEVPEIVHELELALPALGYGYVISRTVGHDAVPESEQQAAVSELNEMGYKVERSADHRELALTPPARSGVKPDPARMMSLILTLRGTRPRVELLARSKEFATDYERYMPR